MTLQSSGIIKMSQIRAELSESGTVNLGRSSWRGLAGKPSGTIKMSDFYGKSSLTVTFVPAAGSGGILRIDESVDTTVTFNTTGAANGTVLYWTVNPGDESPGTATWADFTGSLTIAPSGSFTINSNTGSFPLKGQTDYTTEGDETFVLEIRTGSTSGPIVTTVNGLLVDSSVTPGDVAVVPSYTNGNMTGTLTSSGSTYSINGWTAQASLIYLQPAGSYSPTTISGWPTPTDSTMPSPYVYPITPNTDYTYHVELSTDVPEGFPAGTQSLRLWANGTVPQGYGIVYGPYLVSDSAAALAVNDHAIFWWRAAGGADAYNIYAYLLEINTGATIELLNQNGLNLSASTAWAKVETPINTAGTYRFVFISGTWDQTGGQYLGASLYITGISIFKP